MAICVFGFRKTETNRRRKPVVSISAHDSVGRGGGDDRRGREVGGGGGHFIENKATLFGEEGINSRSYINGHIPLEENASEQSIFRYFCILAFIIFFLLIIKECDDIRLNIMSLDNC